MTQKTHMILGTAFLRSILMALLLRLVRFMRTPMHEHKSTMKHSSIRILMRDIISDVVHGGRPEKIG